MALEGDALKMEIEDGEDILRQLEAESRAFNAKVAAVRPQWVKPEVPAPAEAEGDHFLEPGHFGSEPPEEGGKSEAPFETVCLASVRISPVDWLWEGRIPRGMITLVEGDPGVGKSTFVADIVARHTTGTPFPGGGPARTPEKALWLTLEDSLEHTLKPRVLAAGGDPGMVEARLGVPILARQGRPDAEAIGRLRATVRATGASLMVIDPGAATVEDANSEAIVRQAMGELFKVGQEEGITTIWIRHLVKAREGKTALMAGGGSIGLAAAARSILQVLVDRARKEAGSELDRVVIQPKNNLGREAPPFYFGLEDTKVDEDFMEVHVAKCNWAYQAEEGVDHYDIAESIAKYSKSGEKKAAPSWSDAVYAEFEKNGWAATGEQIAAALSRAGVASKDLNALGSAGRSWKKQHGIVYDTAARVHRMTSPDGDGE